MNELHYICDSYLGGIVVDEILSENQVSLTCHKTTAVSTERGNLSEPVTTTEWWLYWRHGTLFIGDMPEYEAREASALFIYLYLQGIPYPLASTIATDTINWRLKCKNSI
jgi:hypothetical protein